VVQTQYRPSMGSHFVGMSWRNNPNVEILNFIVFYTVKVCLLRNQGKEKQAKSRFALFNV
jgi:hypothetical protein